MKGIITIWKGGLFRGSDRGDGVFRSPEQGYFALRRDLLLPMAAKVGKNAIQTCGLKIRPRYGFLIEIPFPTRSQNMSRVVPYDELTSLLRRCRSCAATVEPKALFDVGISGSGAVAETVL